MGRAGSPLRDRVIFVQGAHRSGTSWLVSLLATHPEIAGVEAESHLFDYGVDRLLDNFEGRHDLPGLRSYLDRDELVDLIRDLCDGVLLAMRSHLGGGAVPPFVVEKTPIASESGGLDLERKRECYPDAWYVHIVRDREAVTRSLMRAPWTTDRSHAACAGLWDRAVGEVRATLGDLPRYREVSYEELRADPAATCGALFSWLGVAADDETLGTVRALSREPFSDLGAVAAPERSRFSTGGLAGRLVAAVRGGLLDRMHGSVARNGRGEGDGSGSELAFKFVRALRERDAGTLCSLTSPSLELIHRSADGDVVLRGDDGRSELARIAELTFARRYVGEWWASAGGPGEWWTAAPGKPFWTMFFSALGGDATRVDLAIGLVVEDDLVRRAVVIAAGPLAGRAVFADLEAPSARVPA